MKAFLDTNVVVDFCAQREPYFKNALAIMDMGFRKEITIIVSALTLVNTVYVLRKVVAKELILKKVERLMDLCDVSPINYWVMRKSVYSGRKDFEDAVQYYSANFANADVIVTRDKSGFCDLDVLVQTPEEFIDFCDREYLKDNNNNK